MKNKLTRLTERDISRIVNKVITEEVGTPPLRDCSSVMKSIGSGPGSSLEMKGQFDRITANFSVSPQHQGYTVFRRGAPFCLIRTN